MGESPSKAWQFFPDNRTTKGNGHLRVLYVESYGAGSHWRVARLFQQRSRHHLDIVRLERDHWRTLALTGHRTISSAVGTLASQHHDCHAIVFSGPADVQRVIAGLPAPWGDIPIIAYFHESQWTYPAGAVDRLPHLVNHLETIESCDAIWFNSRFHRETFYTTALNHPSPAVRALARSLLPHHWHKTHVIYPPVQVANQQLRRSEELTISWSARWERDKRPEIMLDVISALLEQDVALRLHILGSDRISWEEALTTNPALDGTVHERSGYLPRSEYEAALAASDIWLSTAEHEFFGVSAIEASMLGAVPVVPNGLAYPETLPSAIFYPPGDVQGATQRILDISHRHRPFPGPWALDAARYRATRSVAHFDAAIDRVVARY